jgi:hypothetical protein
MLAESIYGDRLEKPVYRVFKATKLCHFMEAVYSLFLAFYIYDDVWLPRELDKELQASAVALNSIHHHSGLFEPHYRLCNHCRELSATNGPLLKSESRTLPSGHPLGMCPKQRKTGAHCSPIWR